MNFFQNLRIFIQKITVQAAIVCLSTSSFWACASRASLQEQRNEGGDFSKLQKIQSGVASYYSSKFKGKKTASGELYAPDKYTAAHKTLAFGTQIYVKSVKNGKQVLVKINDRGPFVAGKILDLSYAAAEKLGMIQAGNMSVEMYKYPN